MVKVVLGGTVLAESDETVILENNHYFPPDAVKKEYFTDSSTSTAAYYSATVNGQTVRDIAWYYPDAKDRAKNIKGYVAFYKNKVQID
ncbi:hypothetical protein EYR40_002767 [Pleurotus pulmonarius]|nr:hypothetical protein EYR40_002767 [Pleurotus pulmonarius]KAF4582381.1 hypothetical protein EYR38_002500 [Pleurotus pulmonarius]